MTVVTVLEGGMRIGEVAERLGMHEKNHSTLRLWISTFAPFLSPEGRGGGGRERRFNEADFALLQFVRQLRSEGHHFEAITEVLDRQIGRNGGKQTSQACSCGNRVGLDPTPNEIGRLRSTLARSEAEIDRARRQLEQASSRIVELESRLAAQQGLMAAVGRIESLPPLPAKRGLQPAELGLVHDERVAPAPCPECGDQAVLTGASPAGRRFLLCSACGWARQAAVKRR